MMEMVIKDRLMITISTAGKEQTAASEKVLDTAAGKNKIEVGTRENVEQNVKRESAKKIEDKGKGKVVKWDYAVLTKTPGGKETKWDYLIEVSKTNKTDGEKESKVDDDHTGRVNDAWDYSMEITSKD